MNSMYEKMSWVQLKTVAKEKGIKNFSTMRKQELVAALSGQEALETSTKEEKKEEVKPPVAAEVREEAQGEAKDQVRRSRIESGNSS